MALWLRWGIFGRKPPYSATPDIGIGSDKAIVEKGKSCHAEGPRKELQSYGVYKNCIKLGLSKCDRGTANPKTALE
jgi:hypothetical protein